MGESIDKIEKQITGLVGCLPEDEKFTRDDWEKILKREDIKLTEAFLEKYGDFLQWNFLMYYRNLSEDYIEKHIEKFDWTFAQYYKDFTEEFMERNESLFDWEGMPMERELSFSFLMKHIDKIDVVSIIESEILNLTDKEYNIFKDIYLMRKRLGSA